MGKDVGNIRRRETVFRMGNILSQDRSARKLDQKRQLHDDREMAHGLAVKTAEEVSEMVVMMNKAVPAEREKFRQQLHRIFSSEEIPESDNLRGLIFVINGALKRDEDAD